MDSCHLVLKVRRCHYYTSHGATHPRLLPLPEYCPLPRRPPRIYQLSPLPPDEPRHTHHRLSFLEVRLQPHPSKHSYRQIQIILYPLMILPRYSSIVRIKYKVSIPRLPSHAVMCLLRAPYLLQYHLHHRIHHDVENNGGCGVALSHSSPCPKRCPRSLTYLRDYPLPLPVII